MEKITQDFIRADITRLQENIRKRADKIRILYDLIARDRQKIKELKEASKNEELTNKS